MSLKARPVALIAAACLACAAAIAHAAAPAAAPIVLETEYVRYVIAPNGHMASFTDKQTGKDYCAREPMTGFGHVRKEGKTYGPVACSASGDLLTVTFGGSAGEIVVRATPKPKWLVFELVSVSDPKFEEVSFGCVRATLGKRTNSMAGVVSDGEFSAVARALNLRTNLRLHGGAAPLLQPYCEARHGLVGAKVALVGCPADRMRAVLKDLVRDEGLLGSPLGGPFALDAEENRGSYVFAYITEKNADEWIAMARSAAMAEIHLMGFEKSLGHYEPRADAFPSGLEGLKAVVAKIHAAGMRAGMHTLTGGIAPHDPFITPVPDKRLGKDAAFTLAESIDEKANTVLTVETPQGLETMWAYSGRGNVIQVDDELIQYTGLAQSAPAGFTGCKRGAFGTKPQPHPKGAPAYHLFVRYGLFQPDETQGLVDDLADCIARVFNTCGFDMIYLDGLEGMAGGWYGEARMADAIFRRLKGRVLVEASNWVYHNWPFHSRLGAYDYPNWGLKRHVDIHCRDMLGYRASSLLAAQLGWWSVLPPTADHPGQFPDEMEYLCTKALAYDAPLSLEDVVAGPKPPHSRQGEYLELIGRYERLRLGRHFPEGILAQLRTPKEDFRLRQAADGAWQLLPTDYAAHKVTGLGDGSAAWTLRNRFGPQPLRLRLEALYVAEPYDSPGGVVLATFKKADEFVPGRAAKGVTAAWAPSKEQVRQGAAASGCFTGKSTMTQRPGSWAEFSKTFTPPLALAKCGALGLWICGDGKGELLNVQPGNPPQFWDAWAEHYVDVNFTGWRYVELHFRERDAERFGDYAWPYGGTSNVLRNPLIRNHTSRLNLWLNNLPPGGEATYYLGPIKALPVGKVKLANPAVAVGDARIVFPVTIESGQYLELEGPADCRLRDERGAVLQTVTPQGAPPNLAPGESKVTFSCEVPDGRPARVKVTVITQGSPLQAAAKP
ncbi:MAG: hypothetical protein IMZ44_09080 [Planctomycetes bacterium]|nr:hypothetical protein [Planctomycetota bacterium]